MERKNIDDMIGRKNELQKELQEVLNCLEPNTEASRLIERDGDCYIDDNGAVPINVNIINFDQYRNTYDNIKKSFKKISEYGW